MGEDFPIVPQELMCNRIVPVIRVWKQWTDKHRTTRKTGSERRTPAPGSWSTVTGVLMSASIHRRLLHHGLLARVPLYRIPLKANHQRLQWAHEHRAWQADWHQVVFSDESCFSLWDHDGHIRARCYANERCLPECVIE
ncbi:UNVERIFIED_CONTAM: hypothetical protein NCL1_22450 [Trichonephila clavipes]